MSSPNVVVDGSNIATEGRSAPSLAQLDEAVREYLREHPEAVITVVVDATFGHRIDDSEREMYEGARSAGEIISPPAGAIGRGDAFLLRIAEKTGATVLSNDSFQEFHGEHDWLFTTGRLIGGVPVQGVGWIFTPRTPVRGPRSREAVKAARRQRPAPATPVPREKRAPGEKPQIGDVKLDTGEVVTASRRRGGRRGGGRAAAETSGREGDGRDGAGREGGARASGARDRAAAAAANAIAAATEEVVAPDQDDNGDKRRRRRRAAGPPAEPVNQPLPFINFVSAHRLGTEVEGEVESFSSHGAFVMVGDVRCYVPLSAMGEPPPRSAREVMGKGEMRTFLVQALDPPRRGVELALPDFAHVAGAPTEETVEAEITEAPPAGEKGAARRAPAKKAATRTAAKKKPVKKAQAKKAATKAPARKAPATKAAVAKAPARQAPANQAPAKKAATKAPAKKTASTKVVVKKAAVKKPAVKKVPARKAATTKAAVKKTPATKAAPKKAASKNTASKKTATKKTAATKASVKKTPAKKTGSR